MKRTSAGAWLVATLLLATFAAEAPAAAQAAARRAAESSPFTDRAAQDEAARQGAARGGASEAEGDDVRKPEDAPSDPAGDAEPEKAGSGGYGDAATSPVIETPAAAATSAAAASPADPALNPLAMVSRDSLKGFRERPLFTPSRRAPSPEAVEPPPEAEPAPVEEAAAPPAPQPNLKLTGVLEGPDDAVAMVQDMDSNTTTQLRPGDMLNGWLVTSVEGVTLTLTLGDRDEQYRLFDPNRKEPSGSPADPDEP